ncbi:DUF397 domain-containing protein [Streptomyces gobiensis]|uniref:DUF397 domain-containing protein n=1 Tax=Streptomyces gobiensis TaxID=2875706 RepID=UPI001E3833F2|nr:DUF397 domain-containing protein [Streptomyces gobiensis]UGY92800.1 DUF397 domain-containing protein [Streptomyces gobiensis]
MSEIRWQKSSYSTNQGDCVELALAPEGTEVILLREGDRPEEIITTSRENLRALVRGLKSGGFHHLS